MTTSPLSVPVKLAPELAARFAGPQLRALESATVEAIDEEEGTILLRAVPYGVETQLDEELFESFAPKAFERAVAAPHRCKLWHEHDGPLIGHAVHLEDRPDGLWTNQKFSSTVAAQEARELARDGSLDQCSITFRPQRNWMRIRKATDGIHITHVRAHLLGVALVPHAQYGEGSRVMAVRDEGSDKAREARRAQILSWTADQS